jgi:hypothetical protein
LWAIIDIRQGTLTPSLHCISTKKAKFKMHKKQHQKY